MATTEFTFTQSAGTSVKKLTVSLWFKLGTGIDATNQGLWGCGTGTSDGISLTYKDDAKLLWNTYDGSTNPKIKTTRQFRDPGAWMHVVVNEDTTNAAGGDRFRMYINGVEETVFDTDTNPVQDSVIPGWSGSGDTMHIGNRVLDGDAFFTGSLAHVHVIDGTIYDASAFGSTDATSGIWVPNSAPSVTYGTNGGFYKFASGALTTDSSGEGNTLSQVGTPIATKDNAMNNFCTLNPLDNYRPGVTFSNGNNTIVTPASSLYAPVTGTVGLSSGKWYWEVKPTTMVTYNEQLVGISSTQTTANSYQLGYYPNDWGYYANNGNSYNNNSSTSYGDAYVANDIIGVALDLTNNKLYFAKNNTWQNSGVPTSGSTGTGALSITAPASTPFGAYLPAATYWHSSSNTYSVNFGNGYFGTTAVTSAEADGNGEGSFEYAPPTGYFALCTNNLGSES